MTTTEMELRLSAVERELAQIKEHIGIPSAEPSGRDEAQLAQEFASLLNAWNEATRFQSDPSKIITHQAYYRLIGLGPRALPYIFRDLQAGGGPWFVALQALTGENPVLPEHARRSHMMRQDWLEWAKAKGYLRE